MAIAASLPVEKIPHFIAAVAKDNLPLAGRCLAASGIGNPKLKLLVEEIRDALHALYRSQSVILGVRIDAGLALGELGHPELIPKQFKVEGKTVWGIIPPMQAVASGEFIRGSDFCDKRAYSDEFTNEPGIVLPGYSIGRYPLTNAEYKFFIDDGGYQTDRWWSQDGHRWKQGGPDAHSYAIEDWFHLYEIFKQQKNLDQFLSQLGRPPEYIRYWKETVQLSQEKIRERAIQLYNRPFDRPTFWDDHNLASPVKPVVGINWYEAEAYCNWLSVVTGHEFRLPTESEWEKAARGADAREYPWGEKFDSNLCNTAESKIYTTTPIGLYPGGVSPFGLFDASGNVWEWTLDWYQMYPGGQSSEEFGKKFRVVRGSAWPSNYRNARCATRNRHVPGDFTNNVGFRILSPG